MKTIPGFPFPAALGFCLVSALIAEAAPPSSADYALAASAIDGGGRRATSANYTNDGSAGLIAGISNVAIADQTAKHGYVAQLFDVIDFAVNGATPGVAETGTLQLAGWQILDDASLLRVPADLIAWAIVNGPLTGVSSAGVATAGVVFEDTPATVQGDFAGVGRQFAFTVQDSIADNFGSYAGDGLGDDWQVQFFGPDNPLAAPAENPDGDLHDNRFEFIAGLDPTDAASIFRLRIEEVPGQPGQKNLIFSPRLDGRTYTVKARPDLLTGAFAPLGSSATGDNGAERTVTDLDAAGAGKFYTVEIAKP